MSSAESAPEGGSYDVIRARLEGQARALRTAAEGLNERRKAAFGGSELAVVGSVRVRTENNFGGMVLVTLQQCDLKRIVQINEATKRYFVMPMGGAAAPAASPATAATKRGGVVTITTTLVDTGERTTGRGRTFTTTEWPL